MIRNTTGGMPAVLAATLLMAALAGCSDNYSNRMPQTTTQVAAQEIEQNTSEFAVPIEINDLPFSEADTTESGRPTPL